jgi:aminobenzoyl-glutamate utilization protein A
LGVPDLADLETGRRAAAARGVGTAELDAMGDGFTGLVATLDSGRPGPKIALRCDIDALPIVESASDSHPPAAQGFRSQNDGVMHACGHDGHAAIVIGVAGVLARLGAPFAGRISFIFQPAEEGTRGAQALVDAGWLDEVDLFLAIHNSGQSGLRTRSIAPGVYDILATRKFDVHFEGREAHFGMSPDKGRSALTAASAVTLLSHAIPRKPGTRSLINVGRLEAGTARNIVPGRALLLAEIRGERDELVDVLYTQMQALIQGIGTSFEVETAITTVGRSPAASSDESAVSLVREAASWFPHLTVTDIVPFEASDDAAAMMRRVQERGGVASYLKIGADLAGGNHTPQFDLKTRHAWSV